MKNIQVFLGFVNLYWHFIQSFTKITGSLILMLETSFKNRLSKNLLLLINVAEFNELGVDGDSDSKDKTVGRLLSKNFNRAIGYLTPATRQTFTQLRQLFTKAPIFRHFDLECYIRIETDISDYAIGKVLSQLTLDNLCQWHPVDYYSQKMILVKTRHKTHDNKLLGIVEAFETWRHYLEGCKHKMLVFTNHNNYYYLMDIKNLSFY